MSLFSRKIKKKLAVSTSKNATYFRRENLITTIDDLQIMLNPLPELKTKKTKKEISFNAFPLTSITFSKIKKDGGNPSFVLDNSENIDDHIVYFYKDGVDYYKFLIQYHFIGDRFFFASNKVSSMGILSTQDKNKIVGQINLKYLDLSEDTPVKDLIIKVADSDNSIITTEDDVYFHVNYLAGNETTKKLIEKYTGHIADTSAPSGFKKSLDKYI
jgi:hypothetical protein